MRGITNAPQGSGGSGGEWVRRPNNSDWSDLIEQSGSNFVIKKDILIKYLATQGYAFVPKGVSGDPIDVGISGDEANGSDLSLYFRFRLVSSTTPIAAIEVKRIDHKYTFTTDGSTVSVAQTITFTDVNKTQLVIYTRD